MADEFHRPPAILLAGPITRVICTATIFQRRGIMRFKSVLCVLVITIAMSLMAASYPTAALSKTWELKLSIEVPEMAPLCKQGFKPWAAAVEKATNGRVKVVIYPSGTLCRVGEMLDAVSSGITDLGWAWPGLHEGVAPLSTVTNLPMLFEKAETGSKAIWELYENNPDVQEEYRDIKLLSIWTTDAYFFMMRKKPIRTMADLKGMKIRAGNATTADFLKYLGATPVMMRMPDVYMALQKGTLDGALAQGEAIQGFKFYEVLKYYIKPGLLPGGHFLIMNKNVWNSMPADVQQQLMQVSGGVLGARIGHDVFDVATQEFPQNIMRQGAKFEMLNLATEEVESWKKAAADPVQHKWVNSLEKKGQPAQKVLDEFKKLVTKYGE
jgi:TRAP-type C4-dicarboxylate transport system substrate-binding protein